MDVYVPGRGRVRLTKSDFVGQGGEGAVYVHGDRAYKLYTDPARVTPAGKVRELSVLTSPQIIRPEEIVVDGQGQPTGYSMRRVAGGFALGQLFTRAFREQKGVTPEKTLSLVRRLQEGVASVHQAGILIVDLNDTNFRVDDLCTEVFFIDVDSYQTPHFPATAIMESIRDRHAAAFSQETDWFSFGIVSFQLFVGIHPYRGKHPAGGNLEERMEKNLSVFRPGVVLPGCCYPLSTIPRAYYDWYRAVLDEGKRIPPPSHAAAVILIPDSAPAVTSSDRLEVRVAAVFPASIVRPIFRCGAVGAVTAEGIYLEGAWHKTGPDVRIGLTPKGQRPAAGYIREGRLRLLDLECGEELAGELCAGAVAECEGRLTVKNGDMLYQVVFMELPTALRAGLEPVANVLAHATQLFDGVAIQNILGTTFAMLLPKPGMCYQVPVPELDGFQIMEARYSHRVMMVSAARNGAYSRFILRFDREFCSYDLRVTPDLPQASLNFAVLESGVCVMVNENDELELFSNRKDSSDRKVVADPAIRGGTLFTDGSRLYLSKERTLFELSLKA